MLAFRCVCSAVLGAWHIKGLQRYGTVIAFGFSGVLLVVMAIQQDRLDKRMIESDDAQRKSDQT